MSAHEFKIGDVVDLMVNNEWTVSTVVAEEAGPRWDVRVPGLGRYHLFNVGPDDPRLRPHVWHPGERVVVREHPEAQGDYDLDAGRTGAICDDAPDDWELVAFDIGGTRLVRRDWLHPAPPEDIEQEQAPRRPDAPVIGMREALAEAERVWREAVFAPRRSPDGAAQPPAASYPMEARARGESCPRCGAFHSSASCPQRLAPPRLYEPMHHPREMAMPEPPRPEPVRGRQARAEWPDASHLDDLRRCCGLTDRDVADVRAFEMRLSEGYFAAATGYRRERLGDGCRESAEGESPAADPDVPRVGWEGTVGEAQARWGNAGLNDWEIDFNGRVATDRVGFGNANGLWVGRVESGKAYFVTLWPSAHIRLLAAPPADDDAERGAEAGSLDPLREWPAGEREEVRTLDPKDFNARVVRQPPGKCPECGVYACGHRHQMEPWGWNGVAAIEPYAHPRNHPLPAVDTATLADLMCEDE